MAALAGGAGGAVAPVPVAVISDSDNIDKRPGVEAGGNKYTDKDLAAAWIPPELRRRIEAVGAADGREVGRLTLEAATCIGRLDEVGELDADEVLPLLTRAFANSPARIYGWTWDLDLGVAIDDGIAAGRRKARREDEELAVDAAAKAAAQARAGGPLEDAADLIESCPDLRPVVVDGLLRRGETMNITASAKTAKSFAALDLALAVVTGGLWMGVFPTTRGRVLLLDNELHRETLSSRIRTVAAARGIKRDEFRGRFSVRCLRGQLRSVDELSRLLADLGVRHGDFDLIICDALYRFLPEGTDENGNADIARVYNHLDALAGEYGSSLALVHHNSKGDQSGKSVTDVGSGAGSLSRAPDTHLVLRPHEEESVAVLEAALRSFPPVPPRCIRWAFPLWSPADDLDPGLLKDPRRRQQEQAREAGLRTDGTELLTCLDRVDPGRNGYGIEALARALGGWDRKKVNRVAAPLMRAGGPLEPCDVQIKAGNGATRDVAGIKRRTRTSEHPSAGCSDG